MPDTFFLCPAWKRKASFPPRAGSSLAGLPSTAIKTMQEECPTSSGSHTRSPSVCTAATQPVPTDPGGSRPHRSRSGHTSCAWFGGGLRERRGQDVCEVGLKGKKACAGRDCLSTSLLATSRYSFQGEDPLFAAGGRRAQALPQDIPPQQQ